MCIYSYILQKFLTIKKIINYKKKKKLRFINNFVIVKFLLELFLFNSSFYYFIYNTNHIIY